MVSLLKEHPVRGDRPSRDQPVMTFSAMTAGQA